MVYGFIVNSYVSYLLTYMSYIRSPVFHIQTTQHYEYSNCNPVTIEKQEVKVIWQKAPHGGPFPG